jgi:hypothetical protein
MIGGDPKRPSEAAMYARVARWEGADGQALRRSSEELATRASTGGPPPGVPATALLMLFDSDSGTSMAITLFDTEEDLRTGDATLNDMSPDGEIGHRVSVEIFEVGVDVRG